MKLATHSMSFFSKFFGKQNTPPSEPAISDHQDPLVPVPIPALGVLLLNLEKQKGSPLSEQEVLQARDNAVCMMLPLSKKRLMDEKRGAARCALTLQSKGRAVMLVLRSYIGARALYFER